MAPPAGIVCPGGLSNACALNGLEVSSTVTDGNCGLDAFRQGLDDAITHGNLRLRNLNTTKRLKKHRTVNEQLAMLRQVGVDWMGKNRKEDMWDGMTYEKLIMLMASGNRDGGFAAHLERMSMDKTWVDCGFLHALGCAFKVDVVVVQAHCDPAYVGFSLSSGADGPVATITVALENDRHFWAALPHRTEVVPYVDQGDFMSHYLKGAQEKPGPGACVSDSDDDVTMVPDISISKYELDDQTIDAELEFITALRGWNPFDEPTANIISAIHNLSGNYAGQRESSLTAEQMAKKCLVRQNVWSDLAAERMAKLPPESEYNGAARWRIKTGQLVSLRQSLHNKSKHNIASALMSLQTDLSSDVVDKSLTGTCCQLCCLDKLANTAAAVRNWRVLWNSMPVYPIASLIPPALKAAYANCCHVLGRYSPMVLGGRAPNGGPARVH